MNEIHFVIDSETQHNISLIVISTFNVLAAASIILFYEWCWKKVAKDKE